jgi:hypothetical protein
VVAGDRLAVALGCNGLDCFLVELFSGSFGKPSHRDPPSSRIKPSCYRPSRLLRTPRVCVGVIEFPDANHRHLLMISIKLLCFVVCD